MAPEPSQQQAAGSAESVVAGRRAAAGESRRRDAVHDHFRTVSGDWGRRYDAAPRRMSDLDLLLRRAAVQAIVRQFLAGARGRVRLLDVGCGAGTLFQGLPLGRLELYGTDFVPEMVAEAARRNPAGHFAAADAANLPFDAESMDIVTCTGVLEYLADPAAGLREMHRVLRPGGGLIASFPNRRSIFRRLSRVEIAVETGVARVRDQLAGRAIRPPGNPAYVRTEWTAAEVRRLLALAGFANCGLMLLNYGLWGRLGRADWALRISCWLSARYNAPSFFTTRSAATMVAHARKAARA